MFNLFKKKTEDPSWVVVATQDGEALPFSAMPDPAFAALGDGVCILPTNGRVCAPMDATVAAVAEAKHAFGLLTGDGAELLIHIGVDTVEMNGQGFQLHVKPGQAVKVGDLLCEVDLDLIRESGYKTHTAILITDCDNFAVEKTFPGSVHAGKDHIFSFKKK